MAMATDPVPGTQADDDRETDPVEPGEEPVCANCGGAISVDDLECPHCGISLVSG